jgi:hypothetical protein
MTVRMISALVAALALLAWPAASQEKTVQKEVTARSGEPTQIGVFGRVTPQCTNGRINIRVVTKATNGSVVSRSGKTKPGAVAKCPSLAADVAAFFYRSNPGYTGTDSVVIEAETDAGQMERHEYAITVN